MSGRGARIGSFAIAGQIAAHGTRSVGDLSHIDPQLTERNQAWGCDPTLSPFDIVGQIKSAAQLQRAGFREEAAVGLELLVWGTREAWVQGGSRLKAEFLSRIKSMAERLYGVGSVAAVRIDRDEPESEIHGSAIVVPVTETITKCGKAKRAVSVKRAIGGANRKQLKRHGQEIQDAAFLTFQDFGVVRGIPSDRVHIPAPEFRRFREWEYSVEKRAAEADHALETADALRTAVEEDQVWNRQFERHLQEQEKLTIERRAQADLAVIEAKAQFERAREMEQAALAARKRAEDAERAAKNAEQIVRAREAKIRMDERAAADMLEAFQHGVDAFLADEAFPLPRRGMWEIRPGISQARRDALTGKHGVQLWKWATEQIRRYATGIDATFKRLGLKDIAQSFGNNPIWKRIRLMERTEQMSAIQEVGPRTQKRPLDIDDSLDQPPRR